MTWEEWDVPGPQPKYDQFGYGGCLVGCGPVAWAMLFCWADIQAGSGNPYWTESWGLYRQNGDYGTDVVAPTSQDAGVENVIRQIHNAVGTFCMGASGATWPWNMGDAAKYLSGRTGAWLDTEYDHFGRDCDDCHDWAIDSIVNRRTPAVIGTGWLNHYPMATAYARQTRIVRLKWGSFSFNMYVTDEVFYVNNGWGGAGNEWVDAGTWFVGELHPQAALAGGTVRHDRPERTARPGDRWNTP